MNSVWGGVIIVFLSLTGPGWAAPGNFEVFRTDKGTFTTGPNAAALEEARLAPDSKPAEHDPTGNWGELVNDCQMSIRFDPTYADGNPLIAHVIVRNASAEPVSYITSVPDTQNRITIMDTYGVSVPLRQNVPRIMAGTTFLVRPGWQRKYDVRLDEAFDLSKPGTYLVKVSRTLRTTNDTEFVVTSGAALITRLVDGAFTIGASISTGPPANQQVTSTKGSSNVAISNSGPVILTAAVTASSSGTAGNSEMSRPSTRTEQPLANFKTTRIGFIVITILAIGVLAILWRAARRKREG